MSTSDQVSSSAVVSEDKQSTMHPLNVEQGGLSPTNMHFDETDSVRDRLPYEHSLHETLKTIAGISGNVLEWYDFAVFGFFGDISEFIM